MTQHDYVIDNAAGSTVRSDLNNVLAAIKTLNSGATAPSSTSAYMLWIDTTATRLKLRNAADSAWIELPLSLTADKSTPADLTVNGALTSTGQIESESGGFKFPDASVQTTASAGKVQQIQQRVMTGTQAINSTSFFNISLLQRTITPGSSSNKILVMLDLKAAIDRTDSPGMIRLKRDSTVIYVGATAGNRTLASSGPVGQLIENWASLNETHPRDHVAIYLDSPSTTSLVTYKVEVCTPQTSTYAFRINRSTEDTDQARYVRTASSLTCIELAP